MSFDQQGNQQPPDQFGQTPVDLVSTNPVVRAMERAVERLDLARSYIERDLDQSRLDVRDLRDRMVRLETKVADLPSKVWIGGVLATGVGVLVALITLIFKLVTGH